MGITLAYFRMSAPSILVVDDQPVNVQLLKRKLEREGIRVNAAFSGAEALEFVRSERPDLILLDVMMPDMDGLEVCARLQANEATRGIPIIFITAFRTSENRRRASQMAADGFLAKPISHHDFASQITAALQQPARRLWAA